MAKDLFNYDTHWSRYVGTGKNRRFITEHLRINSPDELDEEDLQGIRDTIRIKDCPIADLLMNCRGSLRNFFVPKYYGIKMKGCEVHHVLVLQPRQIHRTARVISTIVDTIKPGQSVNLNDQVIIRKS